MVKHRQGWVAFFLLGALTLGVALPAAGAPEEKKIDAIVEALIDAFRRGDYAAIILAAAGLKRLGLASRIRSTIAQEESLPAAGQGALGIEIRADRHDVQAWLAPLHHAPTALAVTAERAVSRILGGSCQVPLAAFAQWTDAGALRLRTFVALPDGSRKLAAEGEATPTTLGDADALGVRVAQQMLDGGAREILAALVVDTPPAT